MVTLDLNIDISKFTEKLNSIVEIYFNEQLICELNANCHKFQCNTLLLQDKNSLTVKRKYLKAKNKTTKNPFKFILAILLYFFVVIGTAIEPFYCFHESEEIFEIIVEGSSPAINITCKEQSYERSLNLKVDCQQCSVCSKKYISISRHELKDEYIERKKSIYLLALSYIVFISFIMLLAFLHNNFTTIFFLTLISAIIEICIVYSLANLKKDYLKKVKQLERAGSIRES